MKLDTSGWKIFRFGDLISSIYKAKAFTKEAVDVCTKADDFVRYVSRTDSNNGVDMIVSRPHLGDVEEPNAITIGDTTATVYYQDGPFVCGDHIVVIRAEWMNMYTGLFIVGLLKQEHYRYSYGRAFLMNLIENTMLKLPATSDGTPDWDFMESYMKTLHYKPLTTKNKPGNAPKLETEKWGNYLLDDFFNIVPGKYHYPSEYDWGTTPYYSASNTNNGISQYISLDPDFEGNCIITGKIGSTAFYAPTPFCATSDVNVFIPKFQMSTFVGLFISGVINFSENYKWAYGRQCRVGNSKKIYIKLPSAPDGAPDWQFMEEYIKALPYGDRL